VSVADSDALSFRSTDRVVDLAREDALDMWQQLRAYGLLSVDDIPPAYEQVAEPFLEVLERLSYIDRTEFITLNDLRSAKAESVSIALDRASSRGVRLVTWTTERSSLGQLALFDDLSVA
jgi:hypothetical protein